MIRAKRIRECPVYWETEYQKSNLWEKKPHRYSYLASKYVKKGKVLDLGCGEGYDCLFFASKGYDVSGIDISPTAIEKMLKEAKRKNLRIKGLIRDITKFSIKDKYDIIVSYGTLHFLGEKFISYLFSLNDKINPNGIHAFYIFGNKGDFYRIAKHRFYFPSAQQLKNVYHDWKILKFEKKNVELLIRGDRGEILHNLMFKILVQKII